MKPINRQREQSWLLGNIEVCLVQGDLFEVPVDSIVTPENTQFRIALPGHHSVSGQLNMLYPQAEEDLYAQTRGEEQPLGTVLETSGYGDYGRMYHLGHHSTDTWHVDELMESEQPDHLRVIRGGIADVLTRFMETDLTSVAFPLIGCGTFGLDPWLVAYEFFDEVTAHAARPEMHDKQVWLVVLEQQEYPKVLNAAIQALSDRQQSGVAWPPIQLGVDYIDRFEERNSKSRHPLWATWTLTRYTELVTGYLFYELCRVWPDPIAPRDVSEEVRSSFGFIHAQLLQLAAKITSGSTSLPSWAHTIADTVAQDRKEQRIQGIIEDRNHIAHGRRARGFYSIQDDLHAFLEETRLHDCVDRMIPEPDLCPWTRLFDDDVGVLDRWESNKWTYVVPYLRESHAVSMS